MSQKENMLHGHLERRGDKLEFLDPIKKKLYADFIQGLEQRQKVDFFLDAQVDDGTLSQIAKVKVCIRELAKETGDTFEDMQLQIKKASGLCIVKYIDGERYLFVKSFGDCSKTELSLAIQAIIEKGEFVRIKFD